MKYFINLAGYSFYDEERLPLGKFDVSQMLDYYCVDLEDRSKLNAESINTLFDFAAPLIRSDFERYWPQCSLKYIAPALAIGESDMPPPWQLLRWFQIMPIGY